MKDFAALQTSCMVAFERILPMRSIPQPGHQWTCRLEVSHIIERIDDWMREGGHDLIELAKAAELLDYFRALPEAGYTVQQCCDALREETAIFTGKKKRRK
jgi:hypothetical protein